MPAKSKSQQRFFGMVRAAQKGDMENPSSAVDAAAKSMTTKDVDDFASTKHEDLPEKVQKEIVGEMIKSRINHYAIREGKTIDGTGKALRAIYQYFKADSLYKRLMASNTTFNGKQVASVQMISARAVALSRRKTAEIRLNMNMPHLKKAGSIAAMTLLAAAVSSYVYKKYLSAAGRACISKGGSEKNVCILRFKIDAYKRTISALQKLKSECGATANPQKCSTRIDRQISKNHQKMNKLMAKI